METKVIVGLGSCGIAAGAVKVFDTLKQLQSDGSAQFSLSRTSCIGMCYREPLVEVIDENGSVIYGNVDDTKAKEIVSRHLINKEIIADWIVKSARHETSDDTFFKGQVKIALRNCGYIDPEKIEEYIAAGGYKALRMIADEKLPSEKVVQMVMDSGLRGRGGGGFPTGLKWKLTLNSKADEKYIICNADEGDPGAFMDRSLLEGDPHSVLEGMIIGAYAVQATGGVVYCRAEYPLAIKRLNIAIEQAREAGFVGKNIAGIEGFNFDLYVKEGAGAFVCGEETALMASVEGKRGMPYKKPPFPAESGLWHKPTNINNVETWANIPWIITEGPAEYASFGTEKSKGTKVFAITGKIKRGGLVEVPMGIPLREIIYTLGGGIQNDGVFKAVQMGGPSGGCIPAALIDTIIDYDSVTSTGAIMGSGGMVVMDETTCMVDVARFFLDFTYKESCGKCTFCRIGTKRMLEILSRICEGEGKEADIEALEELAGQIKDSSLCGLGQTAPNPVLTTLKYFRNEYMAHIVDKKCPAGVCTKLLTYEVIPDKCTGCTVCAKNCPTNAISGERKQIHLVDQATCIKCGMCFTKCTFDAIKKY